ncbi:IucA/IucC family protein [Streptomyces zaomyceticus]|uniref:IucA/IucC family protein n=1 Tax=Streptomyces zaomyceticus TaxID=68286 RepID=UPI00370FB45E
MPMNPLTRAADALAVTPLLNCLLREAAEPMPGGRTTNPVVDPAAEPPGKGSGPGPAPGAGPSPGPAHTPALPAAPPPHTVHRLRVSGRLLRIRPAHRPSAPELWTGHTWRRLGHAELVELAVQEMSAATGRANPALAAEMTASRTAVQAVLAARARVAPPEDPWLRSEQALVMGHPYHPAPKARISPGSPTAWLRYAPEAYARFPLVLLGVREDAVVEDGDTRALDSLGEAPPGYRLLPAHPWQLALSECALRVRAAFAEGRLVRLGVTPGPVRPTASVRTLHIPRDAVGDIPQDGAGDISRDGSGDRAPSPYRGDLFLKFSLDVRITNDIRRMRRHELLHVRRTDPVVAAAFAAMDSPAAWLSDRGHRTVDGLFETCAVLVRDGLDDHLVPGSTAVLTAALAEGFPGNPLDRIADPRPWWAAYLRCVVAPVLEAFARFGVVVECHLQNTLVAVDAEGTPVQAVFRDAEGARTVPEMPRSAAWQRLVYCLVVNNLSEIAGTLAQRFPGSAPALWALARAEFERSGRWTALPDIGDLLSSATVPGKANLLSRWLRAEGTAPHYLPVPNPLRHAPRTEGARSTRT